MHTETRGDVCSNTENARGTESALFAGSVRTSIKHQCPKALLHFCVHPAQPNVPPGDRFSQHNRSIAKLIINATHTGNSNATLLFIPVASVCMSGTTTVELSGCCGCAEEDGPPAAVSLDCCADSVAVGDVLGCVDADDPPAVTVAAPIPRLLVTIRCCPCPDCVREEDGPAAAIAAGCRTRCMETLVWRRSRVCTGSAVEDDDPAPTVAVLLPDCFRTADPVSRCGCARADRPPAAVLLGCGANLADVSGLVDCRPHDGPLLRFLIASDMFHRLKLVH